jgi:hypothetical protein
LIFTPLASYPLPLIHASALTLRSGSRIETLRDDTVGRILRFSSSRERSGTGATKWYWHREAILAAEGDWQELSHDLSYNSPHSTVLKRTLDNALSRALLPTTYNAQLTTALTAREAVLARIQKSREVGKARDGLSLCGRDTTCPFSN